MLTTIIAAKPLSGVLDSRLARTNTCAACVPVLAARFKGQVMLFRFVSFVVVLLTLAGCGSSPSAPDDSNTTTPTTTGGVSTVTGSMSATINGAGWSASGAIVASNGGGLLVVSGADLSAQVVAFAILQPAPGTFPTNNLTASNALVSIGSQTWQTNQSGSTGSIVITTLTSTGASGTFSFTAPAVPGTGASGTKTVTNGAFNVRF